MVPLAQTVFPSQAHLCRALGGLHVWQGKREMGKQHKDTLLVACCSCCTYHPFDTCRALLAWQHIATQLLWPLHMPMPDRSSCDQHSLAYNTCHSAGLFRCSASQAALPHRKVLCEQLHTRCYVCVWRCEWCAAVWVCCCQVLHDGGAVHQPIGAVDQHRHAFPHVLVWDDAVVQFNKLSGLAAQVHLQGSRGRPTMQQCPYCQAMSAVHSCATVC